jgi:hypothetical protein
MRRCDGTEACTHNATPRRSRAPRKASCRLEAAAAYGRARRARARAVSKGPATASLPGGRAEAAGVRCARAGAPAAGAALAGARPCDVWRADAPNLQPRRPRARSRLQRRAADDCRARRDGPAPASLGRRGRWHAAMQCRWRDAGSGEPGGEREAGIGAPQSPDPRSCQFHHTRTGRDWARATRPNSLCRSFREDTTPSAAANAARRRMSAAIAPRRAILPPCRGAARWTGVPRAVRRGGLPGAVATGARLRGCGQKEESRAGACRAVEQACRVACDVAAGAPGGREVLDPGVLGGAALPACPACSATHSAWGAHLAPGTVSSTLAPHRHTRRPASQPAQPAAPRPTQAQQPGRQLDAAHRRPNTQAIAASIAD